MATRARREAYLKRHGVPMPSYVDSARVKERKRRTAAALTERVRALKLIPHLK